MVREKHLPKCQISSIIPGGRCFAPDKMKFDPRLHHRRSIRLKGYDYTQPGAYFITLVTYRRECLFGEIEGETIRLNPLGEIVQQAWLRLPSYFPIRLDDFAVMPNHFHVGAKHLPGQFQSRVIPWRQMLRPNRRKAHNLAPWVPSSRISNLPPPGAPIKWMPYMALPSGSAIITSTSSAMNPN